MDSEIILKAQMLPVWQTIKNAFKYDARAHTFESISPEKGIKYNMPNSCNSCHKDKLPEWAVSVMKGWKK